MARWKGARGVEEGYPASFLLDTYLIDDANQSNNIHRKLRLRPASRVMAYFRITLIRSGIGLPARTNGVLQALGLRKRMQTVYHPISPDTAGNILKVKELVAVSEVEHPMSRQEMRDARQPEAGFWVEKAVSRDGISSP